MGKRRLNGSRFDLLPLGELADLAAIAADKALTDTLSGRAPGAVPPVGDPVAELLVELLAAWAADARRDPPVWDALSAPEIGGVPSVRSPSTPRRPLLQTCPVAPDNRAWLMRCGSPPISAQGALYEQRACSEAVCHPLGVRCRSRVLRRPGRMRGRA